MKRPYPALCRLQSHLLKAVHQRGLCTDESLIAHMVQIGEKPIDPSAIAHWRAGNGSAPLGLLVALLDHVDDPAEVLQILAGPRQLRIVPEGDISTDDRGLLDRVLELGPLLGSVQTVARLAMADGALDMDEREKMHDELEKMIRLLRELSALVDPEASEDSKPVRVLPERNHG